MATVFILVPKGSGASTLFLNTLHTNTHTYTQANVSHDNRAQLAWSEYNDHQKHPANCYINPFWQSPPPPHHICFCYWLMEAPFCWVSVGAKSVFTLFYLVFSYLKNKT